MYVYVLSEDAYDLCTLFFLERYVCLYAVCWVWGGEEMGKPREGNREKRKRGASIHTTKAGLSRRREDTTKKSMWTYLRAAKKRKKSKEQQRTMMI